MPIFRQPVPDPPGARAKPNAIREGDTIKALAESRNVLQRLINLLSPYQPTQIDAIGKRVQVLAIELGDGPIIGGAAVVRPFQLSNASTPEGTKIRVRPSTINEVIPVQFSPGDDPPYIFDVSADGFVFIKVTLLDDGTIDEITLENAAVVPVSDTLNKYAPIGSWIIVTPEPPPSPPPDPFCLVNNVMCGPVTVSVCRNWFSIPPTYNVGFTGS